MEEIKIGQETQFVLHRILHPVYTCSDEIAIPNKSYFEQFDSMMLFRDGIIERCKTLGLYAEDSNEDIAASLRRIISQQCEKNGVVNGEGKPLLNRVTITNWSKGVSPDGKSRKNVYLLCFALEFNAAETAEFFLKHYQNRPFNFKSREEATYFYCLNNKRKYIDAIDIISHVENSYIEQRAPLETMQIGQRLEDIHDDDIFISFLSENCWTISEQHYTVKTKIRSLINECLIYAIKEDAQNNPTEYEVGTKITKPKQVAVNDSLSSDDSNLDLLLKTIYNYDEREMRESQGKTIKDSELPECVKYNFPQRQQFHNILNGNPSDDVLRKAVIVLYFYEHFSALSEAQLTGDFEDDTYYGEEALKEFITDANAVLYHCGYGSLYARNPFDWMFLVCAQAADPIGQFRDFIDYYYLEKAGEA